MEKKTVVQGGHGPVPMEENSRRYIDGDPVEVPMTAYYVRRMLSGELVEHAAPEVKAGDKVTVTVDETPVLTGTVDEVLTAATAPAAVPPSAARVAAPSPSFSKDEDK